MNLIDANSTNKPLWKLEYDACKAFNFTELNPHNWNSVIMEWLKFINGEVSSSE